MKLLRLLLSLLILFLFTNCEDEFITYDLDAEEPDKPDLYADHCAPHVLDINLDSESCLLDIQEATGENAVYIEAYSGAFRTITVNGIANHAVGEFPNARNTSPIVPVLDTYVMTTHPEMAAFPAAGLEYTFGVLFSGVTITAYSEKFYVGARGQLDDWNISALQSTYDFGLDCNNGHVNSEGKYHYHGTPSAYISGLGIDGTEMKKIGYAADGFPIYYKYGYDSDGTSFIALESGYRLKTNDRVGDGITAPSGCPDGLYIQDYEYVFGVSSLDACNGRFGKTPEAEEEYYYVITDNFPSVPLCFSGTPHESFLSAQ